MIEAFLALKEIYAVFDDAERMLEETIGRSICISNCGICCTVNVPQCTTIEAINAISVLTGEAKKQKIVSIAEGWLLDRMPGVTIHDGMVTGWATPQLRDEWLAVSRSQCPFLGSDKRCVIFPVRPLMCRAYGVTRDNADLCPRPLGKGETEVTRTYIKDTHGLFRKLIDDFKAMCKEKNPIWLTSSTVPSVIYRCAEPEKFKHMVENGRIASAKAIGLEMDTNLMWQPQVNAIRAGASPDLVAAMR